MMCTQECWMKLTKAEKQELMKRLRAKVLVETLFSLPDGRF